MIRTARLELRLWTEREDDVAAFFAIWGDPRVIWWGACADRDAARATIARVSARCAGVPACGWFAMIDRATGAVVGSACLQPAPVPAGEIEVGWHVARAHQGRGFATEAARALLDHAWASGLTRVIAEAVPLNGASIAIMRKLGMRYASMVERGGCGHVVFAIDRP
ncbi:MAG TPA: GNAT family N-acetyltransferase [Kofleriaceae bacterium]|nr:GNAT family N-acetyltransferase [Kofleriaceae bacterium]